MSRYLSIEANANGLFVAAGTVRGANATIEAVAHSSENPRPLSASTARELGNELKTLLKDAGIASAPVLLVVGRDRVILSDIKHPPVPPVDEPAVVKFQAIKELTEAPEDVVIDYQPIGRRTGADSTSERRALVAFLRKDYLNAAKVMCEVAGLKLAGVTPSPFALVSAVRLAIAKGAAQPLEETDRPVAIVSLSQTGGEFVVAREGAVRFSRTIPMQSLANEAGLVGLIRRNLAVISSQSGGDDPQAIYLAESTESTASWAGRLSASLPIPVYSFDPLEGVPNTSTLPSAGHGNFVGAVGLLAARGEDPSPINFIAPRQPKAGVDPNRRRYVAAGVLGGGLLAAGAVGSYVLVENSESKVATKRQQLKQLEDDLKARELDEKRLAAAVDFESRQIVWLDELYDLSAKFPDNSKMQLASFLGTSLPLPTEKERLAQSQLPKVKNPPPKPVATLKLSVRAPDGELADNLTATMDSRRDKFFFDAKKKTKGLLTGGKAGVSEFDVEALIAHRSPIDFTRKILVTMPARVVEQIKKSPDVVPDPLEADSKTPAPSNATPSDGKLGDDRP